MKKSWNIVYKSFDGGDWGEKAPKNGFYVLKEKNEITKNLKNKIPKKASRSNKI